MDKWPFSLPKPTVAECEGVIARFACEYHGQGDPGDYMSRGFSCWTCDIRHGWFNMLRYLGPEQLSLPLDGVS